MMEPGVYLFKVSICLTAFYVLYQVAFRHTTFFMLNRTCLLAGLGLSLLIPVLKISAWQGGQFRVFAAEFTPVFLIPSEHLYDPEKSISIVTESFAYSSILRYVYFAGIAIWLARLFYSLYKIHCIRRKSMLVSDDQFKIFKTGLSQPFTFMNHIFLPHYEINDCIVAHERVHARQWHSIDILLVEVVNLFLWFNPLVLLYKKAIQEQHEYLADADTAKNFGHVEQYLAVMLGQIQRENQFNIFSPFYSKSIKNRIIMITKNRTSLKFAGLYVALVPVCSILLFAFANRTTDPSTDPHTSISEPVVIVDPGHGGSDHGTNSANGTLEKRLTLSMAKQIQKIGEEKGIKIILTRSEDVTLPLSHRISATDKFAGKLFISLHFNSNADISKSGIDCIVSESNIAVEQSTVFSNLLLTEFRQVKGLGVNGIKKSNAYVLKNSNIPAVALELGYLSNNADNTFLNSEKNQKLLSEKIVSAIIQYL